jgi:hypothetical protein
LQSSHAAIPAQTSFLQAIWLARTLPYIHRHLGEAKAMESMQKLQITRSVSGQLLVRRRPMPIAKIELDDPAHIAHWCRELGVTWLELVTAANSVGPNVVAVRNALRIRDYWWDGKGSES